MGLFVTKNKQITNTKLYSEILFEEYKNIIPQNRNMEINILITPSKNYFKVYPYNNYKEMTFKTLKNARKYIKIILES